MGFSFTTDALARLEAASRALLSPLAFDDVATWRTSVVEATADAVGASSAMFVLPGQPQFAVAHGLDPAVGDAAKVFLEGVWAGNGHSEDPTLGPFHQFITQNRLEVWDMPAAFHILKIDPRRNINPWRGEVLIPHGMDDTNSLFVPSPQGSIQISLHGFQRAHGPGELFPMLRLLLPSFKAGLDALSRLDAHRAALDAAGEPLAVFDADGAETHRTSALARLLAADPEAAGVERALAAFAQQVRPLAFARRSEAFGAGATTSTVRTRRAAYALRAVLLPAGALGHGDTFVVTVEPQGVAVVFPTPAEIRTRFGLTKREAEVARLVAEGLSNDAIAERLFVSAHTVRHHVEGAMAKLELTGRGRETVAARLLAGAPPHA